jgi:putative ABC transport system permease protein
MIKFLIKGLLRDKSRSRIPMIVVSLGVMLTVLLHAYLKGFMGDTIDINARFTTGHVKVMTKAYSENSDQKPNDLAILNASILREHLEKQFPQLDWAERIEFGGLIDVPDNNGETRSQGPAFGIGLDLLSQGTRESERLNLVKSLVRGNMPNFPGEVLLSDEFAKKLKVNPGDKITFIGSTMNNSMTIYNLTLSGTISFGNEILDRGAIIADLQDARNALDMQDASGEILGFFRDGFYNDKSALAITDIFNSAIKGTDDEFVPVMLTLSQQGSMGQYVKMADYWANYISIVFIFAMSLVLWNAGLLGGLRRYGEFGVRLAMGEEKGHVFRTLIYESVLIGIAGSAAGTLSGLFFAWLIQKYGIDISGLMKGSSLMMPSVIRAQITPSDFYLGFIPGLVSTVLGTMLSGTGIYRRQTSRLFRELEA